MTHKSGCLSALTRSNRDEVPHLCFNIGCRGSPLLETLQKLDQYLVDLFGTLLLHPMPGTGDDHFLFQIRSERTRHLVPTGNHFAYHVMLAGGEHGGLAQLRAVEEGRQFPVAIEIAIPVDSAANARPLELART